MIKLYSNSLGETDKIAKKISSEIIANDVIALKGGLGVGKTTFTKSLVKYLGCECVVSSPTFSLMNHYKANVNIFHFDMYRLKTLDDLYSIGFFDYLNDNNILIIEWSENIKEFLPKNVIEISINYVDDNSREFIIEHYGDDRF